LTPGIAHKRKATTVFIESNKKKRRVVTGHTNVRGRRRRVALIAECVTAINKELWVLMERS
jgi:hypothetical protein